MRKVNLFIAMSLDGYIADSEGGVDWLGGQGEESEDVDVYSAFITKKILHRMYVRIYRKRISRARNRRTFTAYSCSRYEEERDHTTLSDHGSYRFL